MDQVIAQLSIMGKRTEERPFEITLQIGAPYQVSAAPEEWACPVEVKPLYEHLRHAHGSDSFQALCLASALALELLYQFHIENGTLSYSTGKMFSLEAYSFGIAQRSK